MGTITCSCAALGSFGKILTEADGTAPRTFDDSSLRHEILYETLGSERQLQSTNTITGVLPDLASQIRNKSYLVSGTIAMHATPASLSTWLPRIFGGTQSGTNIPVSNTLPTFDALLYRENGIFQCTDLTVAQAVIRGKTSNGGEGMEFMDLIVNVVGKAEIEESLTWPSPEPSLPSGVTTLPYAFFETAFELNSTEINYEAFTMVIDNRLDIRFFNKQTPQCIRSTGRKISLAVQAPFDCDNFDEALALSTTSGTAQFSLSTTGMSTVFDFPAVRNVYKTPTIPGKTLVPIRLALQAQAANAAGAYVTITHDATP